MKCYLEAYTTRYEVSPKDWRRGWESKRKWLVGSTPTSSAIDSEPNLAEVRQTKKPLETEKDSRAGPQQERNAINLIV